jgi:two-component system sensor histidine kinase UhpB
MAAWSARIHPDDQLHVATMIERYMAGGVATFEVEHRVVHKEGSLRWFLCRGVTTERAEGVPVRMVGTDTDITERKQAEHALRRSHERVREMAGRLISAQEEERRRIARDLHDDLSQKVAVLSIWLSRVRQQISATDESLIQDVGQLQSRTAELVNDIRDLSHDIHPSILEHGGLGPALTAFADELNRLEDFELRLDLQEPSEELPPHLALAIYRIAQEAVRNVVRHADTLRAELSLAVHEGGVRLLISDRGRGFDPDGVRESGGLGLVSIEERVRFLNGRLDLSSSDGRGTTLMIDIPVEQAALA